MMTCGVEEVLYPLLITVLVLVFLGEIYVENIPNSCTCVWHVAICYSMYIQIHVLVMYRIYSYTS
jgi:hypothetical protein